MPLIAGISFELIKFPGDNRRRRWVRAIMWPGHPAPVPHDERARPRQLAVAIAALEAVLAAETRAEDEHADDLVGVEVVA